MHKDERKEPSGGRTKKNAHQLLMEVGGLCGHEEERGSRGLDLDASSTALTAPLQCLTLFSEVPPPLSLSQSPLPPSGAMNLFVGVPLRLLAGAIPQWMVLVWNVGLLPTLVDPHPSLPADFEPRRPGTPAQDIGRGQLLLCARVLLERPA